MNKGSPETLYYPILYRFRSVRALDVFWYRSYMVYRRKSGRKTSRAIPLLPIPIIIGKTRGEALSLV
jgi:hypothetical protein